MPCIHTWGADTSLARPTSRCRRTESIVSEIGVCSCAELQVFFLLQRLKGSMLLAAVIKSPYQKFDSCMILVDYVCICIEVFALLIHPDCFILDTGCDETSVKNYELMLCYIPKERPHL